MTLPDVDWSRVRSTVGDRIDILEAAWNDALKRGALGEKLIGDVYKPILESLVPFLQSFTDDAGQPLRDLRAPRGG